MSIYKFLSFKVYKFIIRKKLNLFEFGTINIEQQHDKKELKINE